MGPEQLRSARVLRVSGLAESFARPAKSGSKPGRRAGLGKELERVPEKGALFFIGSIYEKGTHGYTGLPNVQAAS